MWSGKAVYVPANAENGTIWVNGSHCDGAGGGRRDGRVRSSSDERASASTTDGVWNVIQLGDSYSAGTGARDYYGAKKCYRSNNSWAKHYVAKLDELGAPAQLDDVFACSGAVARNLYAENQELYSKTHRESDLLGRTATEWYAWGVQACRDGLTDDDVIASADVRLRGGIGGRFIDAKVDCNY